MTNQPTKPGSPARLRRLGVALYVALLTVLLASVVHGLATLPPL